MLILIILVVITVTIVSIMYLYKHSKKQKEKIRRIYDEQAIKRNGEVYKRFFGLSFPILKFYHNTTKIEVMSSPGGRAPPFTLIICKLDFTLNHNMKIYKEGFAAGISKKIGLQDIEVGIDSFDREVIIKGSDEYFIKSILDYKVQDSILKIIRLYNAQISLEKNNLVIIVQRLIQDKEIFDDLINVAINILDQIKERGSKLR